MWSKQKYIYTSQNTSLLAESFKIVHVKNHILLKCKGVQYEYFSLEKGVDVVHFFLKEWSWNH
jgi:hypothetical protein